MITIIIIIMVVIKVLRQRIIMSKLSGRSVSLIEKNMPSSFHPIRQIVCVEIVSKQIYEVLSYDAKLCTRR